MPAWDDFTGKKFGRLTALSFVRKGPTSFWRCRCDCGNAKDIRAQWLKNGRTRSCGCLRREIAGDLHRKHGRTHTKEYHIWRGMIARCSNPKNPAWKHYGGRGITVSERWRSSFVAFFDDVGVCPDGMTMDRIDNNRGYEPGNVRWASWKTQQRNRRGVIRVAIGGVVKNAAEWRELYGIGKAIYDFRRYKLGWTPERAITTPVKKYIYH